MRLLTSFLFFWREFPRMHRNPGVLMYFFFFWNERLTQTGHCLSVFLLLSLFFVWVPGAFAVKAVLLFCSAVLVVSLFSLWPPKGVAVSGVRARNVREGEVAEVQAVVEVETEMQAVGLGAFRLHPALKFLRSESFSHVAPGGAVLTANVQTSRRGAFKIPVVAAYFPDALGVATILRQAKGNFELLVLPRTMRIRSFNFLTFGRSGRLFSPYFAPSIRRGQDFVGVREYREGDSLRDLHHGAFAKFARPFTKEFAAERGEGVILLLDISCKAMADKARTENAVRLAAGIAAWLFDRSIIGRFFVGSKEIQLAGQGTMNAILEALARAPYPELHHDFPAPATWAPAARPMAPVISVSVLELDSPFITKQIIVAERNESTDDKLFVKLGSETEVSL